MERICPIEPGPRKPTHTGARPRCPAADELAENDKYFSQSTVTFRSWQDQWSSNFLCRGPTPFRIEPQTRARVIEKPATCRYRRSSKLTRPTFCHYTQQKRLRRSYYDLGGGFLFVKSAILFSIAAGGSGWTRRIRGSFLNGWNSAAPIRFPVPFIFQRTIPFSVFSRRGSTSSNFSHFHRQTWAPAFECWIVRCVLTINAVLYNMRSIPGPRFARTSVSRVRKSICWYGRKRNIEGKKGIWSLLYVYVSARGQQLMIGT